MFYLLGELNIGSVFFNDWESIVRTLLIGVGAYVALVLGLRLSGNRTLSKMNAFDFVVTIALGSTLATIILSKQTALAEGVVAFALLISLQYLVTWSSARAPWIKRIVTGEPRLLFHDGHYLGAEMKRARITQDEILSAIRSAGHAHVTDVGAVILETDGSCSVLEKGNRTEGSALQDVNGKPPEKTRIHSRPS